MMMISRQHNRLFHRLDWLGLVPSFQSSSLQSHLCYVPPLKPYSTILYHASSS
jgi:hypothetical protein